MRTTNSVTVILQCVRNFQDTDNISRPKSFGRPPTVRTEKYVQVVKDIEITHNVSVLGE